ncbi:HEAT repeat domain-containing protein [Halocatena halophila]|uniref:HEAT repeat domain-containing protein n=1 Tax=Halocatena halophila TaxID=2814576 RepID=UPI002ED565EC
MSNGDDDTPDTDDTPADTDPSAVSDRLDSIETALSDDEVTESDLDDLEAELESATEAIETLPESDDDDEPSEREQLSDRADELAAAIDDERGPYAEDVSERCDELASRLADTRWTDVGEQDAIDAVGTYAGAVAGLLETTIDEPGDSIEDAVSTLESVRGAIDDSELHPDSDTETITALGDATDDLAADLDDAQEWSDLTVHEQLDYQGFYDVLTPKNRKDYPPELSVVRIAESNNNPEPVLLALEKLTSEFMQENCLDALIRMGPQKAFEEMNERAQKRKQKPIEALGKIGDARALETLIPFIDGDGDPVLQQTTLKALGEIGDTDATQAVANRLVADEPSVRSSAAKALGRIGDTRAIAPLSECLGSDDEDSVRASAAWALNQIGTKAALDAIQSYDDDQSYLVQVEAERATQAFADTEPV